ncbi:hypothetical protein J5H42_16315 [Aeromonas dhakensis]|uniref:hypothetical protein n=1 Tax=Aeromonas dhakensis TaxID=196024 RepID=UPI001AAF0D27|nr:hypothetical protein [Aeromonas dhakensis]MBO2902315.1 hypothetical protein [Aeromonas dhakensis]MBO2995350.1 hypothetical protein [Aeromonas dhakensis]
MPQQSSHILSTTDTLLQHSSVLAIPPEIKTCDSLVYSFSEPSTFYSLERINSTISSIPDGSYPLTIVSAVLGALVAAIAAFSFNVMYWRKLNNDNIKSHYANICLKHLATFEKAALQYWINNKTNENSQEMQLLEVKIRSTFIVLKSSLDNLSKVVIDPTDKENISLFTTTIFDVATGGNFESSFKKTERNTCLKISKECSKITTTILKHSQKIL